MGAGGGFTPPPAQPGGMGERCKLPHRGLGGAEPQKLCKLCVINVLGISPVRGSPPKYHSNEFEIAIVHLKCLLGVRLVIK